jgi:hypothetical protein
MSDRELSEEHCNKISKSCKGMHKGNKHACKRIIQKDMDGNIIKIWNSVVEAAKGVNRASTSISLCARGYVRHSAGFKWEYENEM